MRKALVLGLGVLALVVATAGLAGAHGSKKNDKDFEYQVGLWGDVPYNDTQAQVGVPNLIADMNDAKLAFSVNDGDLKGGNGIPNSATPTTCADGLYTQGLAFLNQLEKPAAFTPGDNDWTDCDRPSNGGFNSLERLDHERQVFFSTPYSLGHKRLKQEVQNDPKHPCLGYVSGPAAGPTVTKDVQCVENRRWEYHDVLYVTLNVQGSCNNLCDTAPNADESAHRDAANIAWLQDSFAEAKAEHDAAVMIISQADPGFDLTGAPYAGTSPDAPTRDPVTLAPAGINTGKSPGFQDFLKALRTEVIAFGEPVAYVHGDTHYFRVDKPFFAADGKRIENFTRVETFGDNAANGNNDVHWVKALVDPKSRDVFAFQAQMVPGN